MDGKISARQFMIVALLFTVGDAILYSPSWIANDAGQDAWIGAMAGFAEALLLGLLFTSLAKRFPGTGITAMCETVLGRWVGAAAALAYIVFFFLDASLMQMEVGDFVTTQAMPDTPIQFILVTFGAIALLASRYGIETFVRVSELIFPWFLLLIVILVGFTVPQFQFENMQPVFEKGMKPIVSGNLRLLGNFGETVILMMLVPHVSRLQGAVKAYYMALIFGMVSIVVVTLACILVIGTDIMVLLQYPSYVLAQKINIGRFFERFEAIMAVIWFITMYMKIGVCFYATVSGLKLLLRLKDGRPLTFPLGMIGVILGLVMVPNRSYFDKFATEIWMPYTSVFFLWIPLLLLIVAILRKKRGKVVSQGSGKDGGNAR
ncbi:endospore germination permease [Paenibacillus sp. MBLB4367]|uniref:GerAB/ArcD/ProY family transporter n=1 Tax=Paenibacillus sp. MBLB4367 TaxID=3384767 RepID=UPI0039084464